MKNAIEQVLATMAFAKLVADTGIEKRIHEDRSVMALTRQFLALPWDTKVFTLMDRKLGQWTADVEKDGPHMTLTPTDAEIDSRFEIAGGAFWKYFVRAFEEAHPGLRLSHDESLLSRLLQEHTPSLSLDLIHRRSADARRADRSGQRANRHQSTEQRRDSRALEQQYQYAIWYQ